MIKVTERDGKSVAMCDLKKQFKEWGIKIPQDVMYVLEKMSTDALYKVTVTVDDMLTSDSIEFANYYYGQIIGYLDCLESLGLIQGFEYERMEKWIYHLKLEMEGYGLILP